MSSVTFYSILIGILISAFIIRTYNLSEKPIITDETISRKIALGIEYEDVHDKRFSFSDARKTSDLSKVTSATVRHDGGNAILFNITLHYWIKLFGFSDFWTRFLSVVFGVVTIFFGARFVHSLTGSRITALILALLLSLNPVLIGLSQQSRAYAMAILLSLLASAIFLKLIDSDDNREIKGRLGIFSLYGIVVAAAVLTQYLTLYIFFAHFIYAVIVVRKKQLWLNLSIAAAVVAILCGSWMMIGGIDGFEFMSEKNQRHLERMQSGEYDNPFFETPTFDKVRHWYFFLFTELTSAGSYWTLLEAGVRVRFLIILLLVPILLVAFALVPGNSKVYVKGSFLILMMAGSSSVAMILLTLKAGHLYFLYPQYSSFSVPYILMLMAIGTERISIVKNRGLRYGLYVCVSLFIIGSMFKVAGHNF